MAAEGIWFQLSQLGWEAQKEYLALILALSFREEKRMKTTQVKRLHPQAL